jgi:hypothetical protein
LRVRFFLSTFIIPCSIFDISFFQILFSVPNKCVSAGFRTATGGGFLAFNPGLDDIGCATDSRSDLDGAGRTILGACAAFHAPIAINDFCFFSAYLKYGMGTDDFTHTAANTCLRIKLQRRDPF